MLHIIYSSELSNNEDIVFYQFAYIVVATLNKFAIYGNAIFGMENPQKVSTC
jgi:hypothetical protein